MRHVDEGTLHALLDGALRAEEPERAREVEAHLDSCADCRARLEQAADLRDRAADVLAGLETGTAASTPDFQEVVARARTGEAGHGGGPAARPPDRIRRQAAWTRGLAWAATIVVALGTGYLVRDLAGPTGMVPGRSTLERAESAAADAPARTDAAAPAAAAEPGQAVGQAGSADLPPPTAARAEEETAAPARAAGEAEAGATESRPRAEAYEAELLPAEQLREIPEAQKLADAVPPITWVEADLEEAEARAGPILVLPNAEVAAAEVPQGDEPLARTLQVLPGGVEIRVVQGPAPARAEGAAADVDAAAAPAPTEPAPLQARTEPAMAEARARLGAGQDSAAVYGAEVRTVTMERGGRVLTLSGPLPAELLQSLARAAAPRGR